MGAILAAALLLAADYRTPAGTAPPSRRPGAISILPGGRMIEPLGRQFTTGPGALALAVSPDGKRIITADGGPNRQSLTVIENDDGQWRSRTISARTDGDEDELSSVGPGLAFENDRDIYVSEGAPGRVHLLDSANGKRRTILLLNQGGLQNSYSGDLALDRGRSLLYVVDRANSRIAVFDTRRRVLIASVGVGNAPSAIALSPDNHRAYAASNGPEGTSLAVVNTNVPTRPFVEKTISMGAPPESGADGGSAGVLATSQTIYVSNASQDSIGTVDARTLERESDIHLRIPGLEDFRGIRPAGLAIDPGRAWLLVAEPGINAVGVVDFVSRRLIGHIPAAWFPSRLAMKGDTVYVANANGFGTGPNATPFAPVERSARAELHKGAVTAFSPPAGVELASLTKRVMDFNGFLARKSDPLPLPKEVTHVVVIVKEGRTFDEIFGDIEKASNGEVRGAPELARWGRRGVVKHIPGELRQRIDAKFINVTPNHHAMADRWSFGDNFHAVPDGGVNDRADVLWRHFDRHSIPFLRFGGGDRASAETPDQSRATRLIAGLSRETALPKLISIELPNDRIAAPQPAEGYPFEASYVADNDYALGRIVEHLSSRPEWKHMAVFVVERSAQGGVDHIDSHRTVVLAAGPYARKNYVASMNSGLPGLWKTVFRLLGVPPLYLSDAAAMDLADCFTDQPDFEPYKALPPTKEIFDPAVVNSLPERFPN